MKHCDACQLDYPDSANYCVNCGRKLASRAGPQAPSRRAGWNIFLLTLLGSLVLSWLLIGVFHLPLFILGAFLPLFWFSGRRR